MPQALKIEQKRRLHNKKIKYTWYDVVEKTMKIVCPGSYNAPSYKDFLMFNLKKKRSKI